MKRLILLIAIAMACFAFSPQSIKKYKAEVFLEEQNKLGEGAIWNYKTNQLWYIDILNGLFKTISLDHSNGATYNMEQHIGTVVPTDQGNAVVALRDGVYQYSLKEKQSTLMTSPDQGIEDIRFNDGKCDPSGRFWVGSIVSKKRAGEASLYRVESKGETTRVLDSITCSNGIVWTSDKRTMYYVDSFDKKVKVFDYDDKTGNVSNRRVAFDVSQYGTPDGMAIDANDNLWVAVWGGSMVGCWDPVSGKLLAKIEVPALNVTSCAFGGKKLDSLFITTAIVGMKKEQRDQYPLAGSIFVATPGVKGVKTDFFKEEKH
ncbi:SMP-30/gluconolactonase/LRE family protein [Reichenbachiella versicolor]|uniref:SMP-30/gluconolactonase/LRE family protein n=1 Tax=Reichenbachiella versicolor TaxID=1821036 RepID=UPI0013A5745C|nr:SMP-30/gluconolactonase/LRE family protein [Reichenbachiella versicolor]